MSDDLSLNDHLIDDQIKKHQALQKAVIFYLNSKDALEHWDEDHMFMEPSEHCQNDREEMVTNLSAAEESMRLAMNALYTYQQHEYTSKSPYAIDFDRLSKEWPITLSDNKDKERMTIWSPRDKRCLHDLEDELDGNEEADLSPEPSRLVPTASGSIKASVRMGPPMEFQSSPESFNLDQSEDVIFESPNFTPDALGELKDRGYVRKNR